MIYTVTFNPAIDYAVRVERFTYGETNRASEESIRPGGKGVNVSIVLKRLGVKSLALAFTGGVTGDALEELIERTGICARFIRCRGNTRINVKLRGERETEVNGVGALVGGEELSALFEALSPLQKGDWLVLAGSVPKGLPPTVYRDVMAALRHRGVNVIVDAAGELLRTSLEEVPFLVKPNLKEIEEVLGVKIDSEEALIGAAKKLRALGARNVIVSLGKDGALMVTETGEIFRRLPPEGRVVDCVGAGDSLVAGFLAAYLETGSYEEAFLSGVSAGSATVFSEWLASGELMLDMKRRMKEKEGTRE
ncbi:MAG: 1-phosphofructokinase [Christensenellaceae bacterium]